MSERNTTTSRRSLPTAGPKPDFLVVETFLKCQTAFGEISLDLRIPFDQITAMIEIEDEDEKKIPSFLMNHVLNPNDAKKLRGLADGMEAFKILMRYAEEIGNRLGAGLGESGSSSD